ncbi:hypothetical protein B0H15DRAFT_461840 [Mycena belliarum]|uniref:Uncharacterized protein n=1 Tax=Mycena belliarum TaxID=1033014 RepID=A0AAD6Y0E1_9AGAR|nr:hypothetical protein B0H15DRAFT_461840 [Mycena belliae]
MSSPFTIIDDRDKNSVSYTGTWVVGGSSHETDATVSSSLTVGDSFKVFFAGTSIGVYGTLDATSAGVQSAYTIDDGSPANVTVPESSSGADRFKQLFWQSDALSNTTHTLTVTMRKVNGVPGGDGEGTIWFDYFNVTGSADRAPGSRKKIDLAAIIAPVIVVVVLAILCGGLLLRRRRHRQQRYNDKDGNPGIEPFVTPTPMRASPLLAVPAAGHRPSKFRPVSDDIDPPMSSPASSQSRSSNKTLRPAASLADLKRQQRDAVSSHRGGVAAPAPAIPVQPESIQHVDSGIRELDPAAVAAPVEFPPVYTPH